MKRRITTALVLFALIFFWGASGFAASPASAQPQSLQATSVNILPTPMQTEIVPVTGNESSNAPRLMMFVFYAFLGMIAVVVLIALFASTNRSATSAHVEQPHTPSEEHSQR